jgi:hypothetical protein
MATPPPTHIGVINESTLVSVEDVAFWTAAVAQQLREHVAPLWGLSPPGTAFYTEKPTGAALLAFVDDDGNAEAAGYHSKIVNLVYGLVDVGQSRVPSQTLSHEAIELFLNPDLTRTVPGPGGRQVFIELCDPVQLETYEIDVEILDKRRAVVVSDFVLPRWFGLSNIDKADNRTTYLANQIGPFETAPGGYYVAKEDDGSVVFVTRGAARMNRSMLSRTRRILERR